MNMSESQTFEPVFNLPGTPDPPKDAAGQATGGTTSPTNNVTMDTRTEQMVPTPAANTSTTTASATHTNKTTTAAAGTFDSPPASHTNNTTAAQVNTAADQPATDDSPPGYSQRDPMMQQQHMSSAPKKVIAPEGSSTDGRWLPPRGVSETPSFVWPDAPDRDIPDNDKAHEPTYKPTQAFKPIIGYEQTQLKESSPIERPPPRPPTAANQTFRDADAAAKLTEEEALEALRSDVASKMCHGKAPAQEMKVEDITYSSAVQYSVASFVECRTTRRLHRPVTDDGETYPLYRKDAMPTGVWDVEIPPENIWEPGEKTVPVPLTSTIETCHACSGRGFTMCYRCKGRGKTTCKHCKSTGKKGDKQCPHCHGNGRQKCFRCNGWACISCSVCDGYKKLEFYIQITSTFKVKKDEYLHNPGKKFPRKRLRDVEGALLYEEENLMISPVTKFPTAEVNSQSQKLLEKHVGVKSERILLQKQLVKGIPIAEVVYTWNIKEGYYWIYGIDRRVYAPDYPHSCCCCRCAIL